MQRTAVLLPEPLRPMMQTTWPRRTSKLMPFSTSRLPKRLCTSRKATTAGGPAAAGAGAEVAVVVIAYAPRARIRASSLRERRDSG